VNLRKVLVFNWSPEDISNPYFWIVGDDCHGAQTFCEFVSKLRGRSSWIDKHDGGSRSVLCEREQTYEFTHVV